MRRLVVSVPGPRVLTWLATSAVWAISAFVFFLLVFFLILLPFNVDCARSGDGPARRNVAGFQDDIAARNWDAACARLTDRVRQDLAETARATHELSPTCPAGLQLMVRSERLSTGRIEKVSAPWVWDDATVTTTAGRYRLTTPESDCNYLISELP